MSSKASRASKGYERHRRYMQALLDGDDNGAFGFVQELLVARRSLSDIYMKLLTPALTGIGDLWSKGNIGVAHEHLATQIAMSHMDRLRSLFSSSNDGSSFRVLVGCIEGEQHFLGARMIADLFLVKGWSISFLGPDVPTSAILDMINVKRPQLVTLSVTGTQGVSHVQRLLKHIGRLPDAPKVLLGGQAFTSGEPWQHRYENCSIAQHIVQGVSMAGRLLPRDRPRAVLKEYLNELGRRVRELRSQQGWTQEQLAESSKLTRGFIVAVEGGKQNVSMDVVVRLANALGISPEDLFVDKSVFSRVHAQGEVV